MRRLCFAMIGVLVSLSVPRDGWAQGIGAASIVGVVRDASGAVLPGVTVEAASPVLIEKVRSDGDRRRRPLPDRGTASGHLSRHLHAAGIHDVQARRPGAVVELRRHGQRRASGRDARPRRSSSRGRHRSWTCAACRRARWSARKRWRCCRRARASAACWRSCRARCRRPTASTPAEPRASSRSASRSSARRPGDMRQMTNGMLYSNLNGDGARPSLLRQPGDRSGERHRSRRRRLGASTSWPARW